MYMDLAFSTKHKKIVVVCVFILIVWIIYCGTYVFLTQEDNKSTTYVRTLTKRKVLIIFYM